MKVKLSEAKKVAKNLAKNLKGGEVLALIGNLGSGKTTFTKALGMALGVENTITSPTFVIMQEYLTTKHKNNKPIWIYHLDLYRTKSFAELEALGLPEIWVNQQAITIIEWADKIYENLPKTTKKIYFQNDILTKK